MNVFEGRKRRVHSSQNNLVIRRNSRTTRSGACCLKEVIIWHVKQVLTTVSIEI